MKHKGINQEKVKQTNRLVVLRQLCTHMGISRAEITRRVGLNKMTVTNIVGELLERGLVREQVQPHDRRSGRPRMGLFLTGQTPLFMGFWLSRDFCHGALVDMNLALLADERIPLGPSETPTTLTGRLTRLARNLLACSSRPVIALGIATIGPLDAENGLLLDPPNFFGLGQVPLGPELARDLELPVFIQNDMNASALAEKYFGLGADTANFAYVGLTNGIGAGMIVNHGLYEGTGGFAGEFGHVVIDRHGQRCHCGNRGCLETLCSVPAILTQFERRFGQPFSSLRQAVDFSAGQPEGYRLLQEACQALALGLVSLCNIMDPELLILGHEGADLPDELLEEMAGAVNRSVLGRRSPPILLRRSGFGALAPLYGAGMIPLRQLLEGGLDYQRFFPE